MIYIHIPYCHQKCTYCAFYSSPTRRDRQPYMDALCLELANRSSEQAHPIRTVYLGGGTPSLLPIGQLAQIVDSLRLHFDLSALQEATLEANPEDLTDNYLQQLAQLHFFNRISIGIQSFRDSDLRRLNRRHSAHEAILAVQRAHQHGFRNISVDLIYGLPYQSLSDWKSNLATLDTILPFITHLSCYALTIEVGTMLHTQIAQSALASADEDTVLAHYQALQDWIARHDWQHYEISSYCRPNFQSRHNSRYWDSTPYLGIGAGAHSFDGTHRRWNASNIQSYIEGILSHTPYFEQETLTPSDRYNEYLMTALRTAQGISLAHIRDQFPWAEQHLQQHVQRYLGTFLITHSDRLVPTPEGLLHADGIAAELFAE